MVNGWLKKLIFYGLLILSWAALSHTSAFPPYLFPTPQKVGQALFDGFSDCTFLIGLAASMQRILIGYTISVIVGTLLGMLVARFKTLDETIGSLFTGLQVLPSICWLPLAILWFGLSEWSIQFVVIMGSLLAVAIATENGIKNIPPIYARAARTMGVEGIHLYRRVILPAALPSMVTGMKLGWSFAWRSLMAGELIFVSAGLGHLLQMGRELHDMAQVVAVMLMITAIGLLFDQLLFAQLERKMRNQWGTVLRN